MKYWFAAAALGASFVNGAALGGPPRSALDLSTTTPDLPPAADTGKPGSPAPLLQGEPPGCGAGIPCGARLLGVIRKDGAVELQVPALRW